MKMGPLDMLQAVPCLSRPVTISRAQAGEIKQLSGVLFRLSFNGGTLVSLALNRERRLGDFRTIVLHKRLDSIYYQVDVHV